MSSDPASTQIRTPLLLQEWTELFSLSTTILISVYFGTVHNVTFFAISASLLTAYGSYTKDQETYDGLLFSVHIP